MKKILFIRDNTYEYIAKIYWSLQNGLSKVCELKSFGVNQDYYKPSIKTYEEIVEYCYGNELPDLIITDFNYNKMKFKYTGIEKLKKQCKITFILGDYWNADKDKLRFASNKYFDFILILFLDAKNYHNTLFNQMIWTPPSVDKHFFKDWELEKEYIVGFLGRGCDTPNDFRYPERYEITEFLKKEFGDKFFTANHPGWGYFKDDHDLIGQGFSKAINKCEMFINTSGVLKHCNPKYFEIMASGSLLLAGDCYYREENYLLDKYNCIYMTKSNILRMIDYYHRYDARRQEIIMNGLDTITKKHSGEIRAKELLDLIF